MKITIEEAIKLIDRRVYYMDKNKVNTGVITGIETFKQKTDLDKNPKDHITFRFDIFRNGWDHYTVSASDCFRTKEDLLDSL